MITATLKERFNTPFGITMVIDASGVIKIGDRITVDGEEYIVDGIPMLAKATPDTPLSVVVRPV